MHLSPTNTLTPPQHSNPPPEKKTSWAWEFLIAEDITNDESICIGAGTKPVTSSSYNSSPNLWMYRCYNGNLCASPRLFV